MVTTVTTSELKPRMVIWFGLDDEPQPLIVKRAEAITPEMMAVVLGTNDRSFQNLIVLSAPAQPWDLALAS